MRSSITIGLSIAVAAGVLTGCRDRGPEKRHYKEVTMAAPPPPAAPDMTAPGMTPPSDGGGEPDMTWTKPEHWTVEAAGGMRLATFRAGDAECTIVALGGQAGGNAANITRWLGQIGIEPEEQRLAEFVAGLPAIKTAGGAEGVLADLGAFNPDLPEDAPSMLAAIIARGNRTVFVKMTGSKAPLASEKAPFQSLCESIQ